MGNILKFKLGINRAKNIEIDTSVKIFKKF